MMKFNSFLITICLLFTVNWLNGEVIYVDSTNVGGIKDGTSWATAYIYLQDALMSASTGDSVFVSKGTYYPDEWTGMDSDNPADSFNIPDGVVMLGGFDPASGATTLADRNYICHRTVLSGDITQESDTEFSYHVVQTTNVSIHTKVDGFIIREGNANGAGDGQGLGGGWYNLGDGMTQISSPVVSNVIFVENGAVSGGGFATQALNEGETFPQLTNTVFTDNAATSGGAIAAASLGVEELIGITIVNCVFTFNSASAGGAIHANAGTDAMVVLDIINSSFLVNFDVNVAGAIAGDEFGGTVDINVSNSIFAENESINGAFDISNEVFIPFPGPGTPADIYYCLFDTDCPDNAICDAGTLTNVDPQILDIEDVLEVPDYSGVVSYLSTSPIIDAGDNGLFAGSSIDQQGNSRIRDGDYDGTETIDIGAHEYQADTCVAFAQAVAYVDSSATGAGTGLTWIDAFTDLQEALLAARCNTNLDTILVAEGTYFPAPVEAMLDACGTYMQDSADVLVSFYVRDGLTLLGAYSSGGGKRDVHKYESILSGDIDHDGTIMNNSYHVVVTIDVSDQTILDGFTITGGDAADFGIEPLLFGEGGGWYNYGDQNRSDPVMRNILFKDNHADYSGGGYFSISFGESLGTATWMQNVDFVNNDALEYGGALAVVSIDTAASELQLHHTGFYGNISEDDGGAVYLYADFDLATINADIINSVFSGNITTDDGGAIDIDSGDEDTVRVNIINSSFFGNLATGDGGALNFRGVSDESSLNVFNSILYGNSALLGAGDNIISGYGSGGPGPMFQNSLLQDDMSICNMITDESIICLGGNKFGINPMFRDGDGPDDIDGTLDDNLRLKMSSPAIDMGDSTLYGSLSVPHNDRDSIHRIVGDEIDMGAYEFLDCSDFSVVYVDESATGTGTGLTWDDAFPNLGALQSIACLDSLDTIKIAEGTYLNPGMDRSISLQLTDSMTVMGGYSAGGSEYDPDQYFSILSGNLGDDGDDTNNQYHVITIDDNASDVQIYDIGITEGQADGGGLRARGGGVLCRGRVTLTRVRIQGNHSAESSPAVWITTSGNLSIIGPSKIKGNSSDEGSIYDMMQGAQLTVDDDVEIKP